MTDDLYPFPFCYSGRHIFPSIDETTSVLYSFPSLKVAGIGMIDASVLVKQ